MATYLSTIRTWFGRFVDELVVDLRLRLSTEHVLRTRLVRVSVRMMVAESEIAATIPIK